jgi:hypothetical protein
LEENMPEPAPPTKKAHRPLGVWLLTIYAAVGKGLFPIVLMLLVWNDSDPVGSELFPTYIIIGNIALGVGIIWSAIETWRGKNRARITFLILVSLSYGLVAYNNFQGLRYLDLSGSMEGAAISRIIRGIIYPALFIWYFTRPGTLPFFNQTNAAKSNAGLE